jgi:tetratricopeptide (TPR) repeat protein
MQPQRNTAPAIGNLLIVLALVLAGCADDPRSRQELTAGEQALAAQQYGQAIRDANSVVTMGDPAYLARANYLRGRAIEALAVTGGDLERARQAYALALTQHPSRPLEAQLHGHLGNASFYQDDYATALQEFTLANAQLQPPDEKVLYLIGVCQQRLGRFIDADRTFQQVQQQYPRTEAAGWARTLEGARGFYVQVGAFSSDADAQRAAAAVASIGAIPTKTMHNDLTIIRTVDVRSWDSAMAVRARLISQYPDAQVKP